MAQSSPPATKGPTGISSRSLLIAAMLFFWGTAVFDGALRWGLMTLGGGSALYLVYSAKFIVVFLLLVVAADSVRRRAIPLSYAVVFFGLVFYWFLGIVSSGNVVQSSFGVFALLSPILGFFCLEAFMEYRRWAVRGAAVLWVASVGGVFWDALSDLPWEGVNYSLQGIEITGNRQWWTFGLDRLSGFSRSSVAAAGQILFLATVLVILSRATYLGFLVWLVSGIAIAMTTTKKVIAVYLLLTFLIPFFSSHLSATVLVKRVWWATPLGIAAGGALLPVSTIFLDYGLDLGNPLLRAALMSFEIRLTETWPVFIETLQQVGGAVSGLGLGFSYTKPAMDYFAGDLHWLPDNLYLNLFATFGVVVVPAVFLGSLGAGVLKPWASEWERLFSVVFISVLLLGITASVLYTVVAPSLFGMSLRYIYLRTVRFRDINARQ